MLNYVMGNLVSIQNMFKKVDVPNRQITTVDEIKAVPVLVIPSVGKFAHTMRQVVKDVFGNSYDKDSIISLVLIAHNTLTF